MIDKPRPGSINNIFSSKKTYYVNVLIYCLKDKVQLKIILEVDSYVF